MMAYQRCSLIQTGSSLLGMWVRVDVKDVFFFVYRIPITVPVGFADFPHEPLPAPEPWIYSSFLDVVQYTEMPRGGHFAAFGETEIFSNDVIQFVEKVEKRIEVSKEASSHGP